MKKLLSSLILVSATLPQAHAEEIDSGFYIFPSIGYFFLDNKREVDNGPTATFAAGYQFNRRWATEVAYGVIDSESNLNGESIDGRHYHLDALYHLNDNDVLQPYLIGGIGNMDLDITGSDNDNETSYNFGAGIKRHFTENLAIRAEARMLYGNDSYAKDTLLNVGLVYLFGESSTSHYVEEAKAEVTEMDSDADGVSDQNDQCPNTPANHTADKNGCSLDSDADGVADGTDQCPNTDTGAKVKADGCHLVLKETVTQTLNIEFANNSSIVPAAYKSEIKALSVFMKSYPDNNVVIEGHSDDRGAAKYNQLLSETRAKAIQKILVEEYGIEAARVTAVGYGEAKPIADNTTSVGRSKNRRVVAVISAEVEK